jgi:hypothetical protein
MPTEVQIYKNQTIVPEDLSTGGPSWDATGNVSINVSGGKFKGPLDGNANTASKLANAVNIGGVSFDGSASINLPGVNSAGSQSTTSNAGSATKLQTARKINGVLFDGTADIEFDLPGVNKEGSQNTTGNANTATKVVGPTDLGETDTVELVRGKMAINDHFRILVGGTGRDRGFAEIATADNGTEPIYVRQYTYTENNGVYNSFANETRSATLLDKDGNTSFPETVSAKIFSGSLTGNATSADTATTATTATNVKGAANSILYNSNKDTTTSSDQLTFNGTTSVLSCGGDIIAFASDERLKTNIEPIENAVDKISKLNGFTYNFNEIGEELGFDTSLRHAGVSAQEVQAVLPEAVCPAPANDEYLTVKYDKLVPLLIEAIKELKEEIKDLKGGK